MRNWLLKLLVNNRIAQSTGFLLSGLEALQQGKYGGVLHFIKAKYKPWISNNFNTKIMKGPQGR